jgi:hypothetical protein
LGWWFDDLAGVGKDRGVEGGRGVEDRRRWRLEEVGRRQRRGVSKEEDQPPLEAGRREAEEEGRRKAEEGGRRKAEEEGKRKTGGGRATMRSYWAGPTGCATPCPHHPGWSIGAPLAIT